MISYEEFIVIHTLYAQGHSISSISRIAAIDRRTISKRLKEDELKPYKKRSYKSKLYFFHICNVECILNISNIP